MKIPDEARLSNPAVVKKSKFKPKTNNNAIITNSDELFNKLNNELKNSKLQLDLTTIFSSKLRELNLINLNEFMKKSSIYDYRCMLANGELVLLLGCGVCTRFIYYLLKH